MPKMKVTTEFAPTGTGEYFGYGSIAAAFSYSRRMTDQFSIGATVRYVEETLDKLKMRGLMIDLGTLYWTGLGSTSFAVTVSNFGNQMAPDGEVVLVGKRVYQSGSHFLLLQCSVLDLHLNLMKQMNIN
jgi:hypothetical protein